MTGGSFGWWLESTLIGSVGLVYMQVWRHACHWGRGVFNETWPNGEGGK